MREQCRALQAVLCHIYIIFLMAVLPVFMGKGYYLLGDTKYFLFRDATLFCLGIWLFLSILSLLQKGKKDIQISVMDVCMICYGVISVISAISSQYLETAMLGYRDWYMGALSQLLLVGIYFLISRSVIDNGLSILIGDLGTFLVLLIAFLQKLEIDPFHLMHSYNDGDWEYSHLISTLGNINWFCGYLGLVIPFAITGYLYAKRKAKAIFLYILSVMGLAMLWMNGSDSGIAMCVILFVCCLIFSMIRTEHFEKTLLLGVGLSVTLPAFSYLVLWRKSTLTFPADGNVFARINHPAWWGVTLVFTVLYIVTLRIKEEERKRWVCGAIYTMIGFGVMGALVLGIRWIPRIFSDSIDWGNGRGALWNLAGKQFLRCNLLEKFIGVGPDCYAEVVYTKNVMEDGHWQGVIFANAHNEWLNQLVNMGLIGLTVYFSVFVTGLMRYRRILLGVMVIAVYVVTATFSFQDVMNAPYLFLILGLCENRIRQ